MLQQIRHQNRIVGLALHICEIAMVAGQQLAVADAEYRRTRIVAIPRESHHIAVAAFDLHDDRRLLDALKLEQRIAQLGRSFKLEIGGSALHHGADTTGDLFRLPVEKVQDVFDHRAVVVERLQADAGRLAASDVPVETGALRHFLRHVVPA